MMGDSASDFGCRCVSLDLFLSDLRQTRWGLGDYPMRLMPLQDLTRGPATPLRLVCFRLRDTELKRR
jgi:hypothetical protein